MASNMALKRAAKANRRKAVLAEKRKLELCNDTLAERVIRASRAPIQHCLVPETLFDAGIGTVILARGFTSNHLMLGLFLVDAWCLGIKDVCFRSAGAETFESMMATVNKRRRWRPSIQATPASCCVTPPPGPRRSALPHIAILPPWNNCSAM